MSGWLTLIFVPHAADLQQFLSFHLTPRYRRSLIFFDITMPDSIDPIDAHDDTTEAVSPSATGGAGTTFEHKVGALCLATLLTGGQPFFLEAASLREVHLQAGHQGKKTDDIALSAIARDGTVRKVLIQVKRSLTVTAKNGEFSDTIKKAFEDFRQEGRFDPNHDLVGIITSSLAAKHARALTNLLDCARASLDTVDFLGRLALPGYLGKSTSEDLEVIKSILGTVAQAPGDEGVWRFLRSLRITDIDLHQDNGLLETCVQSLLAATCTGPGDAEETWRQLRVIASDGTGRADSYTREKLPKELQRRHSKATGYGDGLTRLLDGSEVVLNGIFSELSPGITVPRGELHSKLSEKVADSRMVLITGSAGTGKSAAAKALFSTLRQDGIGLAFRATSLSGSHVDEVLHPYGINLKGISEQSAVHQRKTLWIESVEQLWERPAHERMAFFDLIQKLWVDGSWRIIMTCREYSSDLVSSGISEKLRVRPETVSVKNFTEEELQFVSERLTLLAPLINSPKLKVVIGNAFNLKLATQLQWAPGEAPPSHLRGFREKVWNDVVCKIGEPADGMPARRNRATEEIALKRAKALSPFVDTSTMDHSALSRLVSDGVVAQKAPRSTQHAPAHDVFEDWALILYLQRKFEDECEESLTQLIPQLEEHPAMRRAYRKWLIEMIDHQPAFEAKIIELISRDAVAAHWRDDTLISIILSSAGNDFLIRNIGLLRANRSKMLRQAIHLLRVAGKIDIPRRKFGVNEGGDFSLPRFRGWIGAAYAMYAANDDFSKEDQPFVLSFIEDWIGLTRYGSDFAYPRGSVEISKLLLHEINRTPDDYGNEERRESLFQLLLTLPLAAPKEIAEMIEAALQPGDDGEKDHPILKLGFCYFRSNALVRDIPDLAIRVAEAKLGLNLPLEKVINRRDGYSHEGIDYAFGLTRSYLDDSEASAYSGLFLRLLQHHPERGQTFIVRFINRCCEAYSHPNNRYQHIQPPGKLRFKLATGEEVAQIANDRLWGAYRGLTVAPYLFQSALMALEHWLLEKCKEPDFDLENTLLCLLKESNNVAITSVVASLVVAHPERAGEASLVMVASKWIIISDLNRSSVEQNHSAGMYDFLLHGFKRLMANERKLANAQPHRLKCLRDEIRTLQLTERFGRRVDAIIDAFRAELPPEEECDEDDLRWRIQLNNMDLRTYRQARGHDGENYLIPGVHTPAEQSYVEKKQVGADKAIERLSWLARWSKAFERKLEKYPTPQELNTWLEETVNLSPPENDDSEDKHITRVVGEIKVIAAATCIRDGWTLLTTSRQEWCATTVMDALDEKTQVGHRSFLSGGALSGDTQAAYALIALVGKKLPELIEKRLVPLIAQVVTSNTNELQASAACSIATHLWITDRPLALSCIHALMTFSGEIESRQRQGRVARLRTVENGDTWPEFEAKAQSRARVAIIAKKHPSEAELLRLNWFSQDFSRFSCQIFLMISGSYSDPFVFAAIRNIIDTLPLQKNRRRSSAGGHADDAELRIQLLRRCVDTICHFILQLHADRMPEVLTRFKAAIVASPETGSDFVKWLIVYQQNKIPAESLWTAWQLIADEFLRTNPTKDPHGLMRELFLGRDWKNERTWTPLTGQENRIRNFFVALPPSQDSIEHYTYFLNTIGSSLLPDGLACLAEKLRDEKSSVLLTENAAFYLESILTRLWGESDFSMRSTADRRRMILLLLDRLVTCGSSKAFRLRDDFVTPYAA